MKIVYVAALALSLISTSAMAHEVSAETRNKQAESTAAKAKLTEASSSAKTHGGGLDKYGCHTNHKTGDYHCHR